ncbi:MAG TPA: HAMP domain-containing sensor histidine kinase [Candidatus Dormibacteraeota bacterium]
MSALAAPTNERDRPQRRLGAGNLYLLAHPQSIRSRGGRMAAIFVCITIIGGVLIGEVGVPGNVTFGGFSLIAVLAATWTLPVRLYIPIMAAALALPPYAYILGGVDPLTAKFQFSATAVACVLAILTVRSLKATEAQRQRSHESLMRFTADAAHELRSPLTLMRSTLEHLLRQPRGAAEYEERTRTVLREVERLISVSNSLLVLAQNDAGLLALKNEPVDLGDVIAELDARWQATARNAGVELSTQCPDDARLMGDSAMVGRALDNLVENAVRYTPRGGKVTVTARSDGTMWRLAVADTGTGIPLAFQSRLFERFSRAEDGRGRSSGGVGLGLSLCSAIAQAHGGTIVLDRSSATGTRIVLNLPVTRGSG